jgi:hypothetical protein
MAILQIIYQQKAYEGYAKDYEFSGASTAQDFDGCCRNPRHSFVRSIKWSMQSI